MTTALERLPQRDAGGARQPRVPALRTPREPRRCRGCTSRLVPRRASIAIEWMGASPVYRSACSAMGFAGGDDVETIFRARSSTSASRINTWTSVMRSRAAIADRSGCRALRCAARARAARPDAVRSMPRDRGSDLRRNGGRDNPLARACVRCTVRRAPANRSPALPLERLHRARRRACADPAHGRVRRLAPKLSRSTSGDRAQGAADADYAGAFVPAFRQARAAVAARW